MLAGCIRTVFRPLGPPTSAQANARAPPSTLSHCSGRERRPWISFAVLASKPCTVHQLSVFAPPLVYSANPLARLTNSPRTPPPPPCVPCCVFFPISEYGLVFRLSTVISGFTAYSDWFTGDTILTCFGFDDGRFLADLGVLVAIGAAGLLLAYVLLKRA